MTHLRLLWVGVAFIRITLAQQPTPAETFEVASVKLSSREANPFFFVMRGGPGTKFPTQFTCESVPLIKLLLKAYGIKSYQLRGPSWLETTKYDVAAKVPAGVSEAEFRVMLQNLLHDRFGAVVESKETDVPIYALLVVRNGPKLQAAREASEPLTGSSAGRGDSASDPGSNMQARHKTRLDSNGYPEVASQPDGRIELHILNGKAKLTATNDSMGSLAQRLEFHLERPVADLTGLKGNYAYTLFWMTESVLMAASDSRAGPSVFEALRGQLGLELQERKAKMQVYEVRHMERTPTAN